MKNRYNQIMDKVEVTDEMRERILRNIRSTKLKAPSLKLRLLRYKNYMTAAGIGVLILFAAALPGLINRTVPTEPSPMVIPDIRNFPSAEKLSGAVGFTVTEPKTLPFEVTGKTYTALWKKLAQIKYDGDGQSATYRMSAGSDDNSGDYNDYAAVAEHTVGSYTVTLKGDSSGFTLAMWTDGRFSYSLSLSEAVTEKEILGIIPEAAQQK